MRENLFVSWSDWETRESCRKVISTTAHMLRHKWYRAVKTYLSTNRRIRPVCPDPTFATHREQTAPVKEEQKVVKDG